MPSLSRKLVSTTTFLNALRAFESGALGFEDLRAEIDRALNVERASSHALLAILRRHHAAHPLPPETFEAIAAHLADWPADPTVLTGDASQRVLERGADIRVGSVLQGRFDLVELLGEGGMSRVYRAVDLRRTEAGASDPHVAVKVLTAPFDDYFGSVVALQREAHRLQSLAHPNIVRVYDCDRDGQRVFMTMEYLKGRSLQDMLRAAAPTGLERTRALGIIEDIGAALEYAHRNHIVHGDLKPGNVIVTDEGDVKVIDFGMAQVVGQSEVSAERNVRPIPPKAITPRYASPEMAAGYDPQPVDDVFALACVAYEALTGRHPFGRAGAARDRDPGFTLPRPPRMPMHQYMAIVRALAFRRKYRTPTVRRFLDELLAADRFAPLRQWAWVPALLFLLTAAGLYLPKTHQRSAAMAHSSAVPVPPGSVLRDCPTCPLMTVLPVGRFAQGGSVDAQPFELPRHEVSIGRSVAMSADEVTVGEYRQFVRSTQRDLRGCTVYDGGWRWNAEASWESPGFAQSEMHPATCISWEDAQAYAAWLSARSGHRYRLPSASEWEFAARAGSAESHPWGALQDAACVDANVADRDAARHYPGWNVFPCSDTYVNTAPVGSFRANAFGLHDLFGNVFEWVQDCWHDDYVGAPADGAARLDPGCSEHELRGGSWFSAPTVVDAAYRDRFDHEYRSSSIGIRVVRELSP
jgi:formylglycine-generating enzyme required for sulfatase activity/predicted Ser/Thr protein kinase